MLNTTSLILDNTVISIYGKSTQFSLIESLYAGKVIVPTEVISEAILVPRLEQCIKKGLEDGWMVEQHINYVDHPEQLRSFTQLRKRYDRGEAAVMAIAEHQGGTVGSDDLRATHRYCQQKNIPLLGSLGILYDSYSKGCIDSKEGDRILNIMLRQGYRCPVNNFQQILDWFEKGQGRILY